jgi:hypothetical protein
VKLITAYSGTLYAFEILSANRLVSAMSASEVSAAREPSVAVELGERSLELVASGWNWLVASGRRSGRPTVVDNDPWLRRGQSAIRTGDGASVDIEIDASHMLAAALRFVLRPVGAGATPLEDIDEVGLSRLAEDRVDAGSEERDIHLLRARSTESGAGSVVGFLTLD